MRVLLAVMVASASVWAAPAHACVRLPARSATDVKISAADRGSVERTAVRVCGRTLASATLTGSGTRHKGGTRIVDASAAGHRVAWIEERHRRGARTAIVTLADARRGVLRRFVARRDRSPRRARLHVLLTREGDLAYSAGTSGKRGTVALEQPGKPRKRLDEWTAEGFALEDGRTLLWGDDSVDLLAFDLRHEPCPSRPGFRVYRAPEWPTGRVEVTTRRYEALPFVDGEVTMVRGCDLRTRRDRVLLVSPVHVNDGPYESLWVAGLDRTWVVMTTESYTTFGAGPWSLDAVDVATGRRVHGPSTDTSADPPSGTLAVTDRGVIAWRDEDALYALDRGRVVALDRGGVLSDPVARGDTIAWTHDAVPRSYGG
jgi:hypothetical protein